MTRTDLEALRRENDALRAELAALRAAVGPFPPGHFHSPLPDPAEVARDAGRLFTGTARELPGIDRNEAHQWRRFDELCAFAGEERLPEAPAADVRYHANTAFGYADAFVYYGMLRLLRPKTVIEIGCGFSSALLLDTIERHAEVAPRVQFVEPYPDRLRALLRPGDAERCELHALRAQDLAPAFFDHLQAGDVLFIDSSHVAKVGSDVNFLLFEVLPRLRPGVFVHVHDVPVDFEYPREWIDAGWAWNEAYLVRALLMFNGAFAIDFHGAFLAERDPARCARALPACAGAPGVSLWLQRY